MNDVFIIAIVLLFSIIAMLGSTIKLCHRFPGSFGIMVAGGLSYFLTQVLLQLPIFPLLELNTGNPIAMLAVVGLFTALTATVARYLIVRWILSDKLSWGSAFSAGVGQGFCETIFLFIIFYFIQMAIMQAGQDGEQLIEALFHRSVSYVLIDLFAQISAVCFHIAMYLIIVRGFLKKQEMNGPLLVYMFQILYTYFKYYILSPNQNIWMNLAGVLLIGILSLIYIIQTYNVMNKDNQLDFEKDAAEKALEEGY